MRTLKFTAGSTAFQLMHEATLVAKLERISIAQFRIIAAMQEKFEKAGKPLNTREMVEKGLLDIHGCPKGATIRFEEAEYEMMKRLLEATEFVPRVAREVVGCFDLLDGTEKDPDEADTKPTGRKRGK